MTGAWGLYTRENEEEEKCAQSTLVTSTTPIADDSNKCFARALRSRESRESSRACTTKEHHHPLFFCGVHTTHPLTPPPPAPFSVIVIIYRIRRQLQILSAVAIVTLVAFPSALFFALKNYSAAAGGH